MKKETPGNLKKAVSPNCNAIHKILNFPSSSLELSSTVASRLPKSQNVKRLLDYEATLPVQLVSKLINIGFKCTNCPIKLAKMIENFRFNLIAG